MIYNIPEPSSTSSVNRKELDKQTVVSVLNVIENVNADRISLFRVGKFVENGHIRPIKIKFDSVDTVISLLKNKRKLPDPIKISSDLTLFQRNQLNVLREELLKINKDKVTKTIKCQRHTQNCRYQATIKS